jgi:hypothetical protein
LPYVNNQIYKSSYAYNRLYTVRKSYRSLFVLTFKVYEIEVYTVRVLSSTG